MRPKILLSVGWAFSSISVHQLQQLPALRQGHLYIAIDCVVIVCLTHLLWLLRALRERLS